MNKEANSLIMADGTVFRNSDCGYSERYLWCWINGKTMPECFSIFSDPEKTKEITMIYSNETIVYKGFTELILIKKGTDVFGDETVDVRLTWVEGKEHSIEKLPNEETVEV